MWIHCFLYVEIVIAIIAEQGSLWRVHFSIENEALNFSYRMDMLYDSKSEMVQVHRWPSGVCAVFWGKMPSSSAENLPIQTWCLILLQISLPEQICRMIARPVTAERVLYNGQTRHSRACTVFSIFKNSERRRRCVFPKQMCNSRYKTLPGRKSP